MKIIIGLVGEKGAGKGTFAALLCEMILPRKISHCRFSDILFETLKLWNIETTRENLQKLSIAMNKTYGEGTLSHAVRERMLNSSSEVIILDGVRWESDVELIRSFPNNALLYITADPVRRFRRLKDRKEKAGEGDMSFDQFLKEEQVETEKMISAIGAKADFTIYNDEDDPNFNALREKTKDFYQKYIMTTL